MIFLGVECPQLENPTNGTVSQPNNVSGTIATYTCDLDFVLNGSESQTCIINGTWSAKPPTCIPAPESKQCYEYFMIWFIFSICVNDKCTQKCKSFLSLLNYTHKRQHHTARDLGKNNSFLKLRQIIAHHTSQCFR